MRIIEVRSIEIINKWTSFYGDVEFCCWIEISHVIIILWLHGLFLFQFFIVIFKCKTTICVYYIFGIIIIIH